ncbi:hypothetical protein ACFQ3W_16860 [Paenibacillus puldeungensis]|uniref:Uncharacterized protein n=1 Tax=Paenibacillus puldeungensis TaxID=696536 RepID=A0ABW3S0N9_9BACL
MDGSKVSVSSGKLQSSVVPIVIEM